MQRLVRAIVAHRHSDFPVPSIRRLNRKSLQIRQAEVLQGILTDQSV